MATPSEFFNELIRFEIELFNAVDRRLQTDHGLALTWFEPMQVMDRHGSCRVADVAEELVITVGGASKLVDRIEASGFCRRRPNPDDQRSSLIELTAAGRKILARADESFRDELDKRVAAGLSKSGVQDFTAKIRKLRRVGHSLDADR